jgi:hypothetical protein
LLAAKQADGAEQPELYNQVAEQLGEVARSYAELQQGHRSSQHALLSERYREAPPGAPDLGERLPALLNRYVAALAELPSSELRTAVLQLPRDWRDELVELDLSKAESLQMTMDAGETLARLTTEQGDQRVAAELRALVIERHLEQRRWTSALDLLTEASPSHHFGLCYEGLGSPAQAAPYWELAGDLERALSNFRQAGALDQAARLAEQVGRDNLAEQLRAAHQMTEFERLNREALPDLSEAELGRVSGALRRAAEALAPRYKRTTR